MWIFGHVVVLLENLVDAIVGDRKTVSDAKYMSDDDCASAEALAEVEYSVFEVVRIVCVGSASRCRQLWNLTAVAVLFGELLDPPPTDIKLLSDQPSIHTVVNNSLTNSSSVILSKFHLTWLIAGQIAPTKSLADTTVRQTENGLGYTPSITKEPALFTACK
jgi:hypothetical protein